MWYKKVEEGPTQLYIDRLYCHEVTSPQAFCGTARTRVKVFRPDHVYCMPDHNTPTHDQDKPIEDPVSKTQVDTLAKNAKDFGLAHFGMMDKKKWYYSCSRSGKRADFAGDDNCLW